MIFKQVFKKYLFMCTNLPVQPGQHKRNCQFSEGKGKSFKCFNKQLTFFFIQIIVSYISLNQKKIYLRWVHTEHFLLVFSLEVISLTLVIKESKTIVAKPQPNEHLFASSNLSKKKNTVRNTYDWHTNRSFVLCCICNHLNTLYPPYDQPREKGPI